MFRERRIVCVTPAGRRRYMRLLASQILASPLVDRYDVWVNTKNAPDLRFLDALAQIDGRVNLVAQPDGVVDGTNSIGAFHRLAIEDDTIYIRFDDDVIWIEPDFFERFLAFRVGHPEFLLTMPLIINNAICTALLAHTEKIRVSRPVEMSAMDPIAWSDGPFAKSLHELFLKLAETNDWERLKGGNFPISLARFSINCISWFGSDLAMHPNLVGWNEEVDWTTNAAVRTGKANCITTDAVVSHYAFFPQRYDVDASGLLGRYESLLKARPEPARILAAIEGIYSDADNDDTEGGSTVKAPNIFRRIKIGSRAWRGREITASLPPDTASLHAVS